MIIANKLIQSIADKCLDVVEIENPDTGIIHHREFFNKEMFAKLIIQECVDVIKSDETYTLEEKFMYDDSMQGISMGLRFAVQNIEDRFDMHAADASSWPFPKD